MTDGVPTPQHGRWSTVAWILSVLALVGLIVGVWLRIDGDRAGADLANAIIAGDRPAAPALPAATLDEDARPPKLGDSVTVVNWWASWCGPCRDEAPTLQEVADDYDGRVVVVGVNAQDSATDARGFVREHGIDFPIVRASHADEDRWGVNGFPETYVVGTDGRISSYVNGPIDEETLRGLVDAELDEGRRA